MDIRSLKKYKNELLFIPLGGSNEIGLNCNLYQYDGKWLMVDCGIGFAKTIPGVSLMVPDISILKRIKDNLVGIIITHIHEDHLGAIQYVWDNLRCPIYTSRFTKLFLLEKLKETDFYNEIEVIEVNDGDRFNVGPFDIELIGLTHSAPDMNAVLIKTEKGNILHTGDWKFDDNPVVGEKSDIKRLKQLGARNEVLATVCDSTNIFVEGDSQSESELYKNIYDIVKEKNGLVVCAMFASNVSRLKTVVDVAKKTKREVVLLGSSLYRMAKVAKEIGYLDESINFLSEEDVKNRKSKNLLVIATGCQGEMRAGIDKLANNMSKYIKLAKDDTVIFSSSIIPGNEKDIILVCNKFAEMDVEVINERNAFIHVSGHYSRNDLIKLYNYVKPKIAIAVHGEQVHLKEHQKVAKQCKIKEAIKTKNGLILKFNGKKAEKIGELSVETIAVDGRRLLSVKDEIFKHRKKMEECGAIFVNLITDNKYKLLADPAISTPGVYNLENDRSMQEILKEDIVKSFNKSLRTINSIVNNNGNKIRKRYETSDEKERLITQQIKTYLYKICDFDIGKRPDVLINFTKINNKN